jgi:hypothetical protein
MKDKLPSPSQQHARQLAQPLGGMTGMHFEYVITGSGWAEVTIECGGQRAQFVASYLSDCLRDLARAACDLCAGSREESVAFLDEPGEHHLVMRQMGGGALAIQVLWYEE